MNSTVTKLFLSVSLMTYMAAQAKDGGATHSLTDRGYVGPKETVATKKLEPNRPCDGEKGCDEAIQLKSGKVVGVVIKRVMNKDGVAETYLKDKTSLVGLTWAPISSEQMTFEGATEYCNKLNRQNPPPAGLKSWHVPSKEEFYFAFSHDKNEVLGQLIEVFYNLPYSHENEVVNAQFWTSSTERSDKNYAMAFDKPNGRFSTNLKSMKLPVRCVADQ